MIIGAIGALIPDAIIYFLYNSVLIFIKNEFASLNELLVFLSMDQIFHTLLPLSFGIGIGIGFLGSITTVRKHLRV
jgi:cell division transport system permease protein